MPRAIVVACAGVTLLVTAGCTSMGGKSPLASIHRVRQNMTEEIAAAVNVTQRQASKTWADMLHDWNYTEQDGFSSIRDTSGM